MKDKNSMIIGLAVLAIIAVGVFFVLGGDDNSDDMDDSSNTTQSTEADTDDNEEDEPAAPVETVTPNIVGLAQDTPALSTLVAGVIAADLVDTLSSDGPFTVFAPTDDAFAAALADLGITAEELLARDDLADILTYHVVSGKVMAADLSDGQMVTTVEGGKLAVSISGGVVTLTDANGVAATVTATDVQASNGVVHLIDAVVLPRSN